MIVPPHVQAAWESIHADLQRHLEDAWRERLAFEIEIHVGGEGGVPRRGKVERGESLQYGARRRA